MNEYPSINPIQSADFFDHEHLVFESTDMDEAKHQVGKIFKPHFLNIYSETSSSSTCMHHIQNGNISLNQLRYQNKVLIDPARLEDFYLIHIPITGHAEITCGDKSFISSPQTASIISPSLPLKILWNAGSDHIVIRIEKERFDQHCRQHLGYALAKPIEFEPEFQLNTAAGQYFMNLVTILGATLNSPFPQLKQPLAFEQFESTLINALIYGQDSNLKLDEHTSTISPFYIKRVEEYIHAHTAEPITIEILATCAGVSARTLFNGFQRYREISPMDFVRKVRLEHVRDDLLSEQSIGFSVTEVALRWGFNHLGRFSIEYKRRFGESPSTTLKYKRDNLN